MKRIVVGGQMDKQKIADLIKESAGDKVEVSVTSDIDAAMRVASNQADYYIGSCATGAGAAIAMAIAMIGADMCVSLSIPGKIMNEDEIKQQVDSGKKAFGFVNTDAERIVPALIKILIEEGE